MTGDTVSDAIATKIRDRRRELGLRPADLARLCSGIDVSRTWTDNVIENIESGRRDKGGRRRREITADEVYVLAPALGMTPGEMFIIEAKAGTAAGAVSAVSNMYSVMVRLNDNLDDFGRLQEMVTQMSKIRSQLYVREDDGTFVPLDSADGA